MAAFPQTNLLRDDPGHLLLTGDGPDRRLRRPYGMVLALSCRNI